jgi:hypothetical protein
MPTHKKKYRRTLDEILQSEYVRIYEEAPQKYPIAYVTLARYARESRIRTYGNPAMIHCPEFEQQMKNGFPVIGAQESAA